MFLNTVLTVYVTTQVFLTRQAKLFVQRTEGASGIEYAIIAAMVAIVIIAVSPGIRTSVTAMFDSIKVGLDAKA